MSAIANLKKAHQARAITKDTYSLQDYLAKFKGENGASKDTAIMNLVGIETKYIPSFDVNSPQWNGQASGNGHRTRFILADGSTVGSFSSASHQLFVFFAELMGYTGTETFLHIDITGNIKVEVVVIPLDGKKSTYGFEVIEEGSDLQGFSDYLPTANAVLGLDAPKQYGEDELITAPEVVEVVEEPAEKKAKK